MTDKSQYLTPKQRRSRNREEMIQTIVQAARDVMREEGVAALNLSEIARRLGMQTPSLYEYFPNKLALYDHLFLVGTRLFREQMRRVAAQVDLTSWDQVEQFLTAYLQFAIENPDLFKLVFERHVPNFVPSEASMAEARESLDEATTYFQTSLRMVGIKPALPLEAMRDYFIAVMHGITALHLANNPDQPVGAGRFGSLIPLVIDVLKRAWGQNID